MAVAARTVESQTTHAGHKVRIADPMTPDIDRAEVTGLLLAWSQGDSEALEKLLPVVYEQLRGVAGKMLSQERQGHTLQSTALVHEVYMRLIDLERVRWSDRAHFFAIAAKIMRRVLVDHARHNARLKRGGDQRKVSLDALHDVSLDRPPDMLVLDRALLDLAARDGEQAKLVELRFFGGLNREEIAEVLGISPATVSRRWRMARAWLFRHLANGLPDDPSEL